MLMISKEDIQLLIQEEYGLELDKVIQLDGYIDFNYELRTTDFKKYILKFQTSDPLFFLEAQHTLLDYLNDGENRFPIALHTISGKSIFTYKNYHVRILSFLEGEFLDSLKNRSDQLINSFGAELAQLHVRTSGLQIPSLSHMTLEWDLINLLNLKPHLSLIKSPNLKRLIHYFLLQYRDKVQSELRNLPRQIIHGDANPMNVLVQSDHVSGFIDFGDMSYNYRIFDLAIALAYLLMEQEDELNIASAFISSYHSKNPLQEKEIDLLYYLVAARLCQSQLLCAKSKQHQSDNEYISVDEKRGEELLEQWITINPIKAADAFRQACGFKKTDRQDNEQLLADRHQSISKAQSISYNQPIPMMQSAFQYMYDSMGNTYLDCVNNIMHVGHCHPKVVEAAQIQLSTMNTNTRYLYKSLNDYSAKLLATLPPSLNKIFFINSGSAATDLAIRLARTFTGKKDMLVMEQGYHGNTEVGIDVSSYKFDNSGGTGAKRFIHQLTMPDTYRENVGLNFYKEEAAKITDSFSIAGFIAESILSCGGQLMLPDRFLQEIYTIVRGKGGVCIADEVQVGFGRVGNHFWGFELQTVVPDIVIMGKPIGNGHPMAAVACTDEIAEAFDNGMEFFSSFGGNPVSCVIGLAVLEVIEEEKLQQHALEIGNYMLAQWETLKQRHDCIGDVRGTGLFLGIEFVMDKSTKEPNEKIASTIVNTLKERGVLLSTDGPYHNVIKCKPPMTFSKKDADRLYTELDIVLHELKN